MSAGLSEQQIAEVRARLERARTTAGLGRWADGEYEVVVAGLGDVPALLAEVKRLAARVADLEAERVKLVAAGMLEAAAMVDNDDTCGCGGCDTCIPRALAAAVRDRAYAVAAAGGVA